MQDRGSGSRKQGFAMKKANLISGLGFDLGTTDYDPQS